MSTATTTKRPLLLSPLAKDSTSHSGSTSSTTETAAGNHHHHSNHLHQPQPQHDDDDDDARQVIARMMLPIVSEKDHPLSAATTQRIITRNQQQQQKEQKECTHHQQRNISETSPSSRQGEDPPTNHQQLPKQPAASPESPSNHKKNKANRGPLRLLSSRSILSKRNLLLSEKTTTGSSSSHHRRQASTELEAEVESKQQQAPDPTNTANHTTRAEKTPLHSDNKNHTDDDDKPANKKSRSTRQLWKEASLRLRKGRWFLRGGSSNNGNTTTKDKTDAAAEMLDSFRGLNNNETNGNNNNANGNNNNANGNNKTHPPEAAPEQAPDRTKSPARTRKTMVTAATQQQQQQQQQRPSSQSRSFRRSAARLEAVAPPVTPSSRRSAESRKVLLSPATTLTNDNRDDLISQLSKPSPKRPQSMRDDPGVSPGLSHNSKDGVRRQGSHPNLLLSRSPSSSQHSASSPSRLVTTAQQQHLYHRALSSRTLTTRNGSLTQQSIREQSSRRSSHAVGKDEASPLKALSTSIRPRSSRSGGKPQPQTPVSPRRKASARKLVAAPLEDPLLSPSSRYHRNKKSWNAALVSSDELAHHNHHQNTNMNTDSTNTTSRRSSPNNNNNNSHRNASTSRRAVEIQVAPNPKSSSDNRRSSPTRYHRSPNETPKRTGRSAGRIVSPVLRRLSSPERRVAPIERFPSNEDLLGHESKPSSRHQPLHSDDSSLPNNNNQQQSLLQDTIRPLKPSMAQTLNKVLDSIPAVSGASQLKIDIQDAVLPSLPSRTAALLLWTLELYLQVDDSGDWIFHDAQRLSSERDAMLLSFVVDLDAQEAQHVLQTAQPIEVRLLVADNTNESHSEFRGAIPLAPVAGTDWCVVQTRSRVDGATASSSAAAGLVKIRVQVAPHGLLGSDDNHTSSKNNDDDDDDEHNNKDNAPVDPHHSKDNNTDPIPAVSNNHSIDDDDDDDDLDDDTIDSMMSSVVGDNDE